MHFRKSHVCPISWVCKKQTSVSHSSTEAQIISFDAGLRMDEILAFVLWNLVIEVCHSSQIQSIETKGLCVQGNLLLNTSSKMCTKNQGKVSTKHDNDLCDVDCVPSNEVFSIQRYVVCQ